MQAVEEHTPPRRITSGDIAQWLTPMQAVAWIATQYPAVVLRASLDKADCDRATAVLGDTDDWCDAAPGLKMISLDLLCGREGLADESLNALLGALRDGTVLATACHFDTIAEKRDLRSEIPALQWASVVLRPDRDDGRVLSLYENSPRNQIAALAVKRWKDVLIRTSDLAVEWPISRHAVATRSPEETAVPPEEFVFIDQAASKIQERLSLTKKQAGDILLKAISDGYFETWKKRGLYGERHRHYADRWEGAKLFLDAFADTGAGGITFAGGTTYHLHQFLISEDGFRRWLDREVPAVEPAPAACSTPANAKRPKPSQRAVMGWLNSRLAGWPANAPAPSEKSDWDDARKHFGDGLTRKDFRQIREEATPPEWRTPGPRKPWGQMRNAAENSAKLPRQK